MNKKCTLLLLALFSFLMNGQAQKLCGTDLLTAQRMITEPGFAQAVQQYDSNWAALSQNSTNLIVNTANGPVYEIPVVIHVVHTGGAIGSNYNPGVAQLTGMIDYLNKTYAATWPAYKDTNSYGTRFPIQFTLAKRDPQCNATTGIVRVDGSSIPNYIQYGVARQTSNGCTDAQVKATGIWPVYDYYNVWVVNKIDGWDGHTSGSGVVGYATLPPASPTTDGTVMMAAFAIAGENTLPHEVGHAFSLYHTFQGGSTTACPTNTNCNTQGDLICDTDPQKQTFSCDTTQMNTCTGTVWGHQLLNMMGYSSCPNHFTPGQRTRFLNGLTTYRLGLVSSLGSVAPSGIAVAPATCTPSVTQTGTNNTAGPSQVILNDLTGTSAGGYAADGSIAYLDRTCTQQANLAAGQSYSISVKTGPSPEYVRVWIDYNNDGTFQTSELVYSDTGTTFNETHTGTFTVPATGATVCTPIRMRVTTDRTSTGTPPTACGPNVYGQTEDYAVRITGSSATDTVSIALTAGTNPSCINTPLTFTATATGNVPTTGSMWFVNGVANGNTSPTFSSSALANGDVVTARIYYTGPCGADSATSNAVTVVRQTVAVPTVSIAITGGSNPGCPGQPITFTATPTIGGASPSYTWFVNGVAQTGIPGNTFTTATLVSGNTVTAVLTSSSSCAVPSTATSNAITYITGPQTASAFIYLSSGTNPTCAGKPITFTAVTSNGGPTPGYQWLVNGVAVPGANAPTYTTATLSNLDSVQFVFISSSPCVANPTILSNVIKMAVLPNDTVKLSVAITRGANPGCKDSVLGFTATGTNGGATAAYAWFVNGVQVATGTTYTSAALNNGDVVTARLIAGGPGCRVNDTAYAAPIMLNISLTPLPPVISFIGTMLVSDSVNVQWYGPAGLIAGATGQSYHPTVAGNYYAVSLNGGCASQQSNVLLLSLLNVSQYDLSSVRISPNPTNGQLLIDWGSNPATTRITVFTPSGQAVLRDVAQHAFRKTLDLSGLANGVYFVVLQDESGKAGTVRIVVAK